MSPWRASQFLHGKHQLDLYSRSRYELLPAHPVAAHPRLLGVRTLPLRQTMDVVMVPQLRQAKCNPSLGVPNGCTVNFNLHTMVQASHV